MELLEKIHGAPPFNLTQYENQYSSKNCDIWHWIIHKALLTGNLLKTPLFFTIPQTNSIQHQFCKFSN
jgi:hypothetical protein